MAVRRYSHEEMLDEVGLGSAAAWLEKVRPRPEDEPLGSDITPCEVDVTLVAVFIDCADWKPPEEGVCLALPRPTGVLWATLRDLDGSTGRWRAPRPQAWYWSNRRRGYRVPLDEPAEVILEGQRIRGRFQDVSTTGCRLRLPLAAAAVPVGSSLQVRLPFGRDLWADGEVVRVVEEGADAVILGVRWQALRAVVDQQLANFVFAREREALRGRGRRRP